MKAGEKSEKLARREFFKTVGLAAGAAGVTASVAGGANAETPKTKSDSVGYRETDHVRTYYDLAKF